MASLPLYSMSKKKVGTVELDDSVFSAEVKSHLINDAVRFQVAKHYEHRTANSLTRSQVTGTGAKMYRQKGTGQARHGDGKAPIFVGGGKAHGPRPRQVTRKMNKRSLRTAVISTLSMLQKADRVFILDKLELEKHGTKSVAQCLSAFGLQKALIINGSEDIKEKTFNRSTWNIPKVKTLRPEGVNVLDLLKYQNLVMSQKAVEKLTQRLKQVKEG